MFLVLGLDLPRTWSHRWTLIPPAFFIFFSCFAFGVLYLVFYGLGVGFRPSKSVVPAVDVDSARALRLRVRVAHRQVVLHPWGFVFRA